LTEPAAAPGPGPGLTRWIGSLVERLAAVLLGVPRIAMAHRVWNRYGASSGPLLARGLAFTALFTLVPALVLIASIAGLFVGDPGTRAEIAAFLAAQFPPLAGVLGSALDSALTHAGAFSVVGAVILAWSASGLMRDLDGALGLLFRETGIGRTVLRTVGEVLGVAIAMVGLGLVVVLATVPGPLSELVGLGRLRPTAVLPLAAVFALAFRFLPRSRPSWRDAIVPGAWVGLGASVLTATFALAGPILFGSADLYGAFAGIFLGLVWLSSITQLFLVGAAWVAVRADERSALARPAAAAEAGIR
jgi:membrane protein